MSKIEWTDETWNPLTGCKKISAGCLNCYAERLHDMRFEARLDGKQIPECYSTPFDVVRFHPDRLEKPLHWRKPRRVFVCSMGDLFLAGDKVLKQIFQVMKQAKDHTFQILTKRPDRMREFLGSLDCADYGNWPLPNVWIGVTVENQEMADERIPILLDTRAAVRFISVEPMLGPIDLRNIPTSDLYIDALRDEQDPQDYAGTPALDWVICGGETGSPWADIRPMDPSWVRSLRDQCNAAEVPFFFKQWGDKPSHELKEGETVYEAIIAGYDTKARKGGRNLDGRIWDEFPPIPQATLKLKIQYPTNKRKWLSKTTYQNIYKEVELSPVRVLRSPCGTGAAASRYYYQADFAAPKDAAFSHGGMIRTNIKRKWNPHFNPKKLEWDGDICNSPCV